MSLLARLFGKRPAKAHIAQWAQSQHGEDQEVLSLLSGKAAKVVVDVGANDGHAWSNSYLFGRLGYRLILVEPMPAYAQKCRELWAGKADVVVEEAAVSTAPGEAIFFINRDAAADLLAMRSSLGKSNVPGGDVEEIKVKVERLDTILERAACPADYAFLSVDAEGFDRHVLESAGLDRFRPEIICVEDEVDPGGACRNLLQGHGYEPVTRLGSNGIYRRLKKPPSHPPAPQSPPRLWIDGPDAAPILEARRRAGVVAPHTASELISLLQEGFVVLPGRIDEELLAACPPRKDEADPHRVAAVRDLFSHPRILTLLAAIFDADPLLFASRAIKDGGPAFPSVSAADLVVDPFRQAVCFIACATGVLQVRQSDQGETGWRSLRLDRGQKVLLHASLDYQPMTEGYLGHYCPLGVAPTYFIADERFRGAARHRGLAYSSAHFLV